MLIDEILPAPHFSERHGALYSATTAETMQAVHDLDISRSLVARALLMLRGLPHRDLRLREVTRFGFTVVAETPNEIVFGLIARPWTWGTDVRTVEPEQFVAFCEPGYAKIAWSFHVGEQSWHESRLTTETRVRCTDERSRRRFSLYWLAVRPFSGLIRREALRLVSASLGG